MFCSGLGFFGMMVLIFEDGDMVVVITETTSFKPLSDRVKITDLEELIDSCIG